MRATPSFRLFALLLLCVVGLPLVAVLGWVWLRGQSFTEWSDLLPGVTTGICVLGVAAWLAAAAGLVLLAVASERRRRYLIAKAPQGLVAALDAPEAHIRRMALQALADNDGQPFGLVACWPFQRHTPAQFEALVMLYKEWLAIRGHVGGGMVSRHVLRRLRTPVRAVMAEKCFGAPSGVREVPESCPLKTLSKAEFLSAMRGRVEAALGQMADVLDRGTPGRLASTAEERVRALLAGLFYDALDLGIRLRMNRRGPVRSTPPGPVDKFLDRAAVVVKDAILDWNPDGDERPEPPAAPLPPLEPAKFVAALRAPVEEFIRSAAESLNAVPDLDGMAATEDDIRALAEHFVRQVFTAAAEQRLDAAAARLPTAGAEGAWAKKLRRMLAAEGRVPEADG
jgi:hypothetical protein